MFEQRLKKYASMELRFKSKEMAKQNCLTSLKTNEVILAESYFGMRTCSIRGAKKSQQIHVICLAAAITSR